MGVGGATAGGQSAATHSDGPQMGQDVGAAGLAFGAVDVASWVAIVGPITTLLGGLGGYWLAGRNEEARDQRAALRETAVRREALAERLEEDRHTFQRDTLLELQDELQRLARVTAKINFQDRETLIERGQLYRLPDGLNDEAFQITVAVQRLRARVLDGELRQRIADFIDVCNRNTALLAEKDRDTILAGLDLHNQQISDSYVALSELLGEHLRRELDRRDLAQMEAIRKRNG